MSEQSPVTATSLPPLALTNAARPGVTSGGIALLPAGVYSLTVQFSKNTAANVLVPAMCVARDSEHRSVHRTMPAVEHTTSLCRSLFLASSIVGPTASGSPASALAAAAAAAAKGSSSPPSSWQCKVTGAGRVGTWAAPDDPGASIR